MRSFARKLLVPIATIAFACLLTLGVHAAFAQDAGTAAATQPTAAPAGDLSAAIASGNEATLLARAWDAVTRGDYAPAAVILLIAAVWFIRMDHTKIPYVGLYIDRTFGRLVKWSRSDRGGVVAVFVTSILAGVLHTITVGGVHALSGSTLKTALVIGVGAIGGFTGVKRFFWPSDAVPLDSTDAPTQPNANKPGA